MSIFTPPIYTKKDTQTISTEPIKVITAEVHSDYDKPINFDVPVLVHSGGVKKQFTARSILQKAKNKIKSSLVSCNFGEARLLSIFNEALFNDFLIDTEHYWNFLLAKHTIFLEAGKIAYPLPSGHWHPVNLFGRKDYSFYGIHTRFSRIQPMEESENYNNFYSYTVTGEQIRIFLPVYLENCNSCGKCNECKKIYGSLTYEFLYFPNEPTTLDENLYWFPPFPEAEMYLIELLIEGIYRANGNETYISTKGQKLRKSLIMTDKSLSINNISKKNHQTLTFSKY